MQTSACDSSDAPEAEAHASGGKADDTSTNAARPRIQPIDTAFMIPFPGIQPFEMSWWTELGGVPGVATNANRLKVDGCLQGFTRSDAAATCEAPDCYALSDGGFCTGGCAEGTTLVEDAGRHRCATPSENHQNVHLRVADATLGPLLSRAQFDVLAQAGFNARKLAALGDDTYDRLYVTAVRFDPSAPRAFESDGSASPSGKAQLRLIVQRDGFIGGVPDAAIHLVYSVDDPDGAIERLFAIKQTCEDGLGEPTDGVPVGPHPCLTLASSAESAPASSFPFVRPDGSGDRARAELAGVVLLEIRDLIAAFARPESLDAVAMMVANASEFSQTAWQWRAFTNVDGTLVQLPRMANHGGCQGDEGCVEDAMTFLRREGRITPVASTTLESPSGSRFGVAELNRLASTLYGANEARVGLPAAYVAENPRLSRFPVDAAFSSSTSDGNDCATCHVQGPIISHAVQRKSHVFDGPTRDAIAQVRYEGPPGLNCEVHEGAFRNLDAQPNPTDGSAVSSVVLNMGFEVDNIELNSRTTNEACEVARYINEELLGSPDTCEVDVEVRLATPTSPGQDLALYGTFGPSGRVEVLPFAKFGPLEHVEGGRVWSGRASIPSGEEARFNVTMIDGTQGRCFRWESGGARPLACGDDVVVEVSGFGDCQPGAGPSGKR